MTGEPYGVLGLSRGAGFDDVRRAYRRLALESHPDTNGPSEIDRFISVQTAYDAIAQERQGASYGQTGAAIVPRSAVVPDIARTMSPPPGSPPRIDLFEVLAPPRPQDAIAAYLRHVRLAPPSLVDVCC